MHVSSPFLLMALAGAGILVLPGMLILALAADTRDLTLGERLSFGAAVSWCVIVAACVLAFTFEWNIGRVARVLAGTDAVLAAAWLYRRRPWRAPAPDRWHLSVLLGIALVSVLAYRVGGYTNTQIGPTVAPGWSTMEELLQVSTVRKILDAPRLRFNEVMYAKGEFSTYFYPVYPFALALLSRVSGLDPIIVFDTFRLWTAALALLAFFALACGALGPRLGTIATGVALMLVAAGQAGQAPGFGSWGQLVPVTHIGDFGLGVLLPLALAVVVRFALEEPGTYTFSVLALPFLVCTAVTHSREAAHLASYLAAALLIGPFTGAFTRRQWLRLAGLLAGLMLIVSAYSVYVQRTVPFIREYETASLARARVDSGAALHSGVAYVLHPTETPPLLRPYVTLAFLLAPVALVAFRRSTGVVLLAAGVVCWWLPLHLPIAGRVLERAVYSEIMASPTRYVFHASYLFYGVAIYFALRALDRAIDTVFSINVAWDRSTAPGGTAAAPSAVGFSFTCWPWLAAAIAGLLLAQLPALADAAFAPRPLWTGIAILTLAVVAACTGMGATVRSILTSTAPVRHPWFMAIAVVVLCVAVTTSLRSRTLIGAAEARGWPQVGDVAEWYQHAAIRQTLPWSAVQMIRATVPPRAVLASDPQLGLAIPFVTDQYILVSGSNFTTDLHYLEAVDRATGVTFNPKDIDWSRYAQQFGGSVPADLRGDIESWERYYSRLQRLVSITSPGRQPLFREEEDDAQTAVLFAALRPEYVLVSPAAHTRLLRFMQARPDRFERVAADGSFQIYRAQYSDLKAAW